MSQDYAKNKDAINKRAREMYALNREEYNRKAKARRDARKEERNEKNRKKYAEKREEILAWRNEYFNRPGNKEKQRTYAREYMRRRVREDVDFRMLKLLRDRFKQALRGEYKTGSAIDLLGMPVKEFKELIASKFHHGMTWDKYLSGEIHLDHIRPCSSFDLTDPEQQRQCFHYSNYQPLWKEDNLRKHNKWNPSVLTNPTPKSPLSEPQCPTKHTIFKPTTPTESTSTVVSPSCSTVSSPSEVLGLESLKSPTPPKSPLSIPSDPQ